MTNATSILTRKPVVVVQKTLWARCALEKRSTAILADGTIITRCARLSVARRTHFIWQGKRRVNPAFFASTTKVIFVAKLCKEAICGRRAIKQIEVCRKLSCCEGSGGA